MPKAKTPPPTPTPGEPPAPPAPALAVEWWPIDRPTPYPGNPRVNAAAVPKVAASLREFGWRQPLVVDEAGVILAGHTRLLAARELGMATVPVHIARGLTPAQARAYRLADNRTAQEAEWDLTALGAELAELRALDFDLPLTGFEAEEIAAALPDEEGPATTPDPDDVPSPPAEPITTLGDLIQMGRHRLVCGDATDAGAWDLLMAGERADAVWTDPPYGVRYGEKNAHLNRHDAGSQAGWSRLETPIENDTLPPERLRDLLSASLGWAWEHCRPGAAWYVTAPSGPLFYEFAAVLRGLAVWRQPLVWRKDSFVFGRSDYHHQHEAVFYGWKEGAAHTWSGDRSQSTVLDFPRPRRSDEHPTMKPVALVAYCLRNSTAPGNLVVDPFAGSGTTLMACEAGRLTARCIELSPAYCDVIVQRWEAATGQKAVRP